MYGIGWNVGGRASQRVSRHLIIVTLIQLIAVRFAQARPYPILGPIVSERVGGESMMFVCFVCGVFCAFSCVDIRCD
jgi:hypothetical protein